MHTQLRHSHEKAEEKLMTTPLLALFKRVLPSLYSLLRLFVFTQPCMQVCLSGPLCSCLVLSGSVCLCV